MGSAEAEGLIESVQGKGWGISQSLALPCTLNTGSGHIGEALYCKAFY